MRDTKSLTTGKIQILNISRNDYEKSRTRNTYIKRLAFDLYNNLPDFKSDIYWIQKVLPIGSYTALDVINEYIKNFGEGKFIFCLAGEIISNIDAEGNISDAIKKIDEQREDLLEAGFYNIIFNRIMARTCRNSMYFIYMNDDARTFVKNNMDPDPTNRKIISRVTGKKN